MSKLLAGIFGITLIALIVGIAFFGLYLLTAGINYLTLKFTGVPFTMCDGVITLIVIQIAYIFNKLFIDIMD